MRSEYSARDLSGLLSISLQAVHSRAKREKWAYCEAPNSSGGGVQKIYLSDSFSPKTRDKIKKKELDMALNNGCGNPVNPMQLPVQQTTIQTYGSSTAGRVIVPQRADEVGLAKYRLVMKWREVLSSQGRGGKGEAAQAFMLAYRTGRLLPGVYDLVGDISLPSLYRMDKQLRVADDDYYALADGRGGWKRHGTTKWRERNLGHNAIEQFLCCWLQSSQPSIKMAVLAARNILQEKGIDETASDATFRRWLKDWAKRNQHVIVLAREGEKAYRDKVAPYITRDDGALEVGQVLVADGHDLNFEILHPRTGRPCRMKLIVFFDWASRMPVGCQIMPTENTVAIMAALRMAISALGKIPQAVYLDNGRAFKAKMFTETDPDLRELMGIYGRLGIAVAFAQPYNARAKLVERYFSTLSDQFEKFMPTFCGGSIDKKPAWRMRNEKFHAAWHQARTQGWVPNVREAAYMLGQFTRWYGEQAHDGLRGRKPLAVLEAGRGPGVDVADLNWQFLWRKKVTPDRCRVRLYGIEYESDCLHGWGEPVYAMHDMNNLNSIYIYSMSGDFLGEAAPVEAMSPLAKLFADQVSVDRVQAEIARQRRLTKQTKQNLIELGATADEVESLKGLPWCQRAEITEDREQKTDDSRQRPGPIKLLRGREDDLLVVDEPDQQPEDSGRNTENSGGDPAIAADERPLFGNDTERYFWACEQIIARTRISDRDLEFVGEYEADHANRVSVSLMRAKMEAASMGGRDGI